MPLARILTLNPEDANVFAQQLRELGFDVEVVNPNEEQPFPADLEIEFAICDQQQVLGRAAAIAAQLQAEVVVFPGAIPPLPKPIPAIAEAAELSADLAIDSRFDSMEASTEGPEPIVEQPELASHQLSDFAPTLETQPVQERRTASAFSALAGGLHRGVLGLRAALIDVSSKMRTASASGTKAIGAQARRLRERTSVYAARVRTAREQRLAMSRERHAEAALRAAALEQQRRREAEFAAAAHQQELQRMQAENERRLAEAERLRSKSHEQVAAIGETRLTAEAQHQYDQRSAPTEQKRAWSMAPRNGQLRGAFAGAVAASLFFILGMILANLNALTPLSRSLVNSSVEEQLPFGPTTLHAPPASTKPASAVSRPQIPAAAPAQPAPFAKKPNPARTTVPGNKPSPEWHHFQRSSSAGEDTTANDVVVKRFGPARKTTQTAQQEAGLKHYSDQ